MNKPRHPLPASEEAQHERIPERIEDEKGDGDDAAKPSAPEPKRAPDGAIYPS
jgi:hypothetical protein